MVPGEKRSSRTLWNAFLIVGVLLLAPSLPALAAEGKGSQEGYRASEIKDETVKNRGDEEIKMRINSPLRPNQPDDPPGEDSLPNQAPPHA